MMTQVRTPGEGDDKKGQAVDHSPSRPNRIRCLFLVHHIEAIEAVADVYFAMQASGDFEPIVLSIPRRFPGSAGYGSEDVTHQALDRMGIDHFRFHLLDDNACADAIRLMRPAFLFRQAPWDYDIQPGFGFQRLAFTKVCYIPYAYPIIERYNVKGTAEDFQHESYHGFLRSCWRIFCETEASFDSFHRQTKTRANLRVTGSPKFDRLASACQAEPYWPIRSSVTPRPYRIIWAPHHSIGEDWLGFGVFITIVGDMINWLVADKTIEIVLKPHPALFDRLRDMGAEDLAKRFLECWALLPNAAIAEGSQYGALFAGSDAMITDGISFLVEYQFADKPLIYIDSGRHVPFNAAGETMLDSVYTARSFAESRALVDELRATMPDRLSAARKTFVQEHLKADGRSASRIIDSLRESLSDHVVTDDEGPATSLWGTG